MYDSYVIVFCENEQYPFQYLVPEWENIPISRYTTVSRCSSNSLRSPYTFQRRPLSVKEENKCNKSI